MRIWKELHLGGSICASSIASGQLGGDLILAPKHKVTVTANYELPLDESIAA